MLGMCCLAHLLQMPKPHPAFMVIAKSLKLKVVFPAALVEAVAPVVELPEDWVALRAYEQEQRLPQNTATLEQVQATSAGVHGYASSNLGVGIRERAAADMAVAVAPVGPADCTPLEK